MIGIFDSGLGGLTVLKEIHALMPLCDLLYLGDTAYLPYGTKSSELVADRALFCGRFLEERGAQVVVIACNTASACALNLLQKELSVPVVGVIEPLIDALGEKNRRIGLLATPTTLSSRAYQEAIKERLPQAHVYVAPAPELVPMVESGKEDQSVIKKVLKPLISAKIDTLILGCTHFPLLKASIAKEMGDGVEILESGPFCANHLEHLSYREGSGNLACHVTEDGHHFGSMASLFLGSISPLPFSS